MLICITSVGDNLNSQIDSRFGRAQFLIFVDTNTMEYEAIENQNRNASGGAGVQTAQMVIEKGVEAVITGNVGPKAYDILNEAEIKIITNLNGTIKDAIEKFKSGNYKEISEPTTEKKH